MDIRAYDSEMEVMYYPSTTDLSSPVFPKVVASWDRDGIVIVAPLEFIHSNSNVLEIHQCTPYTDKTGEPIYENDVMTVNINDEEFVCYIRFDPLAMAFVMTVLTGDEDDSACRRNWNELSKLREYSTGNPEFYLTYCRVFGNTRQHLHLIKQKFC